SSSSSPSPLTPIKMRSLNDIYAETEEVNMFCLYANHEPHTFEEAVEEECWRTAMEEEIQAKNNTWDLTLLPQGERTIGVN
ncbi:hypothetical protein PJP07_30275, partial [Mycobacterium kansasii]